MAGAYTVRVIGRMNQIKLSKNAVRVLEARYLKRDKTGKVSESPKQLFERVARAVSNAELLSGNAQQAGYWEEQFYQMLSSLDFLPNSPTLMNAGTTLGQLSACFVLPVKDSIEGIFDSIKQMALIQRTGGGTGFCFSKLRPNGDIVASTGGKASGAVSFMKIFNCATDHIKQGGRRRGANMGILRVDHPDIEEFISVKRDESALQNFNISVAATDRFMEAVNRKETYRIVHPRNGKIVGRLPAKEIFDKIVEAAWHTGDPGLIFLDTINKANTTPHLGTIEATNPCGEIPLLPYESCNLGSINLARMTVERNNAMLLDWEKLGRTVHKAIRFLDDVTIVNKYPLARIEQITTGNRKVGLGVMGFAETLIQLGISYDSDEAVNFAKRLMGFIAGHAFDASKILAEERGVFANWKGSFHEAKNAGVRNATCTAIAPTGTISIISDTTASIEPLFALAYRRKHVLEGHSLYEINPTVIKVLKRYGLKPEKLAEQVSDKGGLKQLRGVPDEIRRVLVPALEIPPWRHLQIQAAFQDYVDNSVSKTINLSREATIQDISDIYRQAWNLGLKGITIYRYASKSQQVLELESGEEITRFEHFSTCDPNECSF